MKFSIIIATLGRKDEISCLMYSLSIQTYQDFEVIIIDQNPPEFLQEIRDLWKGKYSVWKNVDFRAANRARNMGLDLATGNIITFADDDCEYVPETLKIVNEIFNNNPQLSAITGKAIDAVSGEDCMAVWPKEKIFVSTSNVLTLSLEFTTFYRSDVLNNEKFDPDFGPGTPYGSREGPDLLLRLMYSGKKILYTPEVTIHHPNKFTNFSDEIFLRRTKLYEQGFGALLAKHLLIFQTMRIFLFLFSHFLLFPILGFVKSIILLRPDKLHFWIVIIKARSKGFASYFFRKKTN